VLTLLITASLSFISIYERRTSSVRELHVQANTMAATLVGHADGDEEFKRILGHATVNPALAFACVLNDEGAVRAQVAGVAYDNTRNLSCDPATYVNLQADYILVRSPLMDKDLPTPVGEVVLIGAAPSPKKYVAGWLGLGLVLSLLFGAVCWLIGQRFERSFLRPIRHIASTAQRVTLYKDYSLRVVSGPLLALPREVESLTESFNAMLHEIEDRNGRLLRKSEELDKARGAAVAANQAKSQFLANVSHELRTPLNAILGFSTMIAGEQFGPLGNPKYKDYARDINESGKHLLDVINDILDITRAESGSLKITIEQLNLAKIIEKALNIVAGQAHQRKIDIYTDLPPKLPKLYADRVRVIQILLNLLSNAIRFTPEGGKVVIRARAEPGRNGLYYFTLQIEDNGIGMSQAEIAKAFAAFNQSDMGLNRKYDGAGLGLPLTKRLVELHHGKMKIDSIPGTGTTVTVRLTSDPALLA